MQKVGFYISDIAGAPSHYVGTVKNYAQIGLQTLAG